MRFDVVIFGTDWQNLVRCDKGDFLARRLSNLFRVPFFTLFSSYFVSQAADAIIRTRGITENRLSTRAIRSTARPYIHDQIDVTASTMVAWREVKLLSSVVRGRERRRRRHTDGESFYHRSRRVDGKI